MTNSPVNKVLKTILRNVALMTIPLCLATAATGQSQMESQNENAGAAQRIDASGKLRMLSQRVVAAGCYVHAGIDTPKTTAMLKSATAEFNLIAAGLEFGNPDIAMYGAEADPKILATLKRLHGIWDPIAETVDKVIEGTATQEDIAHIAVQSEPLLDMAKRLVSAVTAEYSLGNGMVMRDAFAIDIAGRQRMLAQRISKDICLLGTGIETTASMEDLAKTAGIFDMSLKSLRAGMPSVGILAPTDPQVIKDLNIAAEDWAIVQVKIADVLAGNPISADRLSEMFDLANTLTADMNKVVLDYTALHGEGL